METLSEKAVDQRATMITKCEAHVVVNLKSVRNIDVKSFPNNLQTQWTSDIVHSRSGGQINKQYSDSTIDIYLFLYGLKFLDLFI